MKNFEKYKTAKERHEAFYKFCQGKTCDRCVLGCNHYKSAISCALEWIDLESEEVKAMACPFCGHQIAGTSRTVRGVSLLCSCGYESCKYDTLQEAIVNHNRICRAVAAYNKSEVK